MIKFDNKYVDEWNRKIVFAPNGFGKTTNSMKLKEEIDKSYRTLLFTRREISNLVSTYKNKIFFGETAILSENNNRLKDNFKTINPIKGYLKTNYGSINLAKIKKESFTFGSASIKKIDDLTDILALENRILKNSIYIFKKEEALLLDKKLNIQYYNESKEILDNTSNIKKTKIKKNHTPITEEIYNYLLECRKYIENVSENNKCLLCGKNFKTKNNLLHAVDKKMAKYYVLNGSNIYDRLTNLVSKIYVLCNDIKIKNINLTDLIFMDLNINNIEIKDMIKILKNYISICDYNVHILTKDILNITFGDSTIFDIINIYRVNCAKINKEKNDLSNIKRFKTYICSELDKIISSNYNITFESPENELELKIKIDGIEIDKSLYEILSESEIKRFCLVVLRALIKYGKYNVLILDDPIDSYDDYYMLVACNYIKTILSESKLVNWYVFTNNFDALYNLSQSLKCDSYIYYQNPDDLFNKKGNISITSFISTYKEIQEVNLNEINLMYRFLKEQITADNDLSFIAFIVTLRNFNALVLNQYENIVIKRGNKRGNIYTSEDDFKKELKCFVEHYYMHYDYNNNVSYGINSDTVTIKQIANLYNKVSKFKNNKYISNYSQNNNSIVSYRETILKKNFDQFVGNRLLNLIFFKIAAFSYLKYEFEKKIILKLKNDYLWNTNDMNKIINTNSLGKKIKTMIEINKQIYNNATDYLKKCVQIFEENNLLFNMFEHGLENMYPPYIVTNIKDIRKFKMSIDALV